MRNFLIACIGVPLLFSTASTYAQKTITISMDHNDEDAMVSSSAPNQNFGNSSELNAACIGTNSDVLRSYLKFDFSQIPPGSTILSAYLTLINNPTSAYNNGSHSTLSGPNTTYIRRVTEPWAESTITWNNQPSLSPVNTVQIPTSTQPNQDYFNLDIKSITQDIVNFPLKNFGICLHLLTESGNRGLIFSSSDHINSSLHPKMTITYTTTVYACKNIKLNTHYFEDVLLSNLNGEENINWDSSFEFNSLSWTNQSNHVDHRTIFNFDLDSLLQNQKVISAKLNLFYCSSFNSNGPHSQLNGPNQSHIYKVKHPWSSSTVTWVNQPQIDSNNSTLVPSHIFDDDNYFGIDISNICINFQNNPSENFGMLLKLDNESQYRRLVFASSNHPDSLIRPEIELVYIPKTNQESEQQGITVYPNPSIGSFTISSFQFTVSPIEVELYNTLGQMIMHSPNEVVTNEKKLLLDFSNLANGVYNIQLRQNGNLFNARILIYH